MHALVSDVLSVRIDNGERSFSSTVYKCILYAQECPEWGVTPRPPQFFWNISAYSPALKTNFLFSKTIISACQLEYLCFNQTIGAYVSTHDGVKKRIHTYAFLFFIFILFYIFVLLISHVHLPPKK